MGDHLGKDSIEVILKKILNPSVKLQKGKNAVDKAKKDCG
jgi:hypothetical protein